MFINDPESQKRINELEKSYTNHIKMKSRRRLMATHNMGSPEYMDFEEVSSPSPEYDYDDPKVRSRYEA